MAKEKMTSDEGVRRAQLSAGIYHLEIIQYPGHIEIDIRLKPDNHNDQIIVHKSVNMASLFAHPVEVIFPYFHYATLKKFPAMLDWLAAAQSIAQSLDRLIVVESDFWKTVTVVTVDGRLEAVFSGEPVPEMAGLAMEPGEPKAASSPWPPVPQAPAVSATRRSASEDSVSQPSGPRFAYHELTGAGASIVARMEDLVMMTHDVFHLIKINGIPQAITKRLVYPASLQPPDFGPCCQCGQPSETVLNFIFHPHRTAIAGTGWGCFICGLSMDGVIAVFCDTCVAGDELKTNWICLGHPASGQRMSVDLLDPESHFLHDLSKHGFKAPPVEVSEETTVEANG